MYYKEVRIIYFYNNNIRNWLCDKKKMILMENKLNRFYVYRRTLTV